MPVEIRQVESKQDLREFITFPNRLYKGNPYFVPKMAFDEENSLDPAKNPTSEFCESALYLAYKDGKTVGRVAAIINHKANDTWKHDEVRYGWIDFIDDMEVSAALLSKVQDFGRAHGMKKIVGPLGFTDFDAEGMVVDGFDKISTLFLLYNYPYYPKHLEALGYKKEVDWIEYNITIPRDYNDPKFERVRRIASLVKERYHVHVKKPTKAEVMRKGLGQEIFKMINKTYGPLYNFTQFTPKMVDTYVKSYLGFIDMRYVTLIVDDSDKILAFGISLPSVTRAFQKAGGHLFPFGWFHVLKSMFLKHEESIELMLAGVDPEWKKTGIYALLFDDLVPRYIKGGFKYAETNAELETNIKISKPWEMFDYKPVKRRRIYGKDL